MTDDKVHRNENVHIESSHRSEKGSHKNSESSRKEQPKGSYKGIKLRKTAAYIVERIGAFSDITAEILSEELGISYRQVLKHIENLTKAGIIERDGGKRYGKWKVKE